MAKIRFTRDFRLQSEVRGNPLYKAGREMEVNEGTARRYIRRGVAVRVDNPPTTAGASGDDAGLFAGAPEQDAGDAAADDSSGDDAKPKSGGGKSKKRERIE